jgi:hypothetical protein
MSQSRFETHEIFSQSPPYQGVDLFANDRLLPDRARGRCR